MKFPSNEIYDVAIIGGGPAGVTTAYKCAKAGLKVAVLERDREIGVPVRCAEGIMTKFLAEFGDIPDSVIASQINKIILLPPNKQPIYVNASVKGVILNRELFDKFLAKKALAQGAEILLRHDVATADYDELSHLFKLTIKQQAKPIQARIVVGADGIDSKVGRWFKLSEQLTTNDIDSCAQYLLYDESIIDQEVKFIFDTEYAPGGYVWVFPKGDKTANVGLGVSPLKATQSAKAYLDEFILHNFPQANALRFTSGAVPIRQSNSVLAKNRVLLVGDAAYQTNAISGGGIDTAIEAGLLCGEIVANSFEKKGINDKTLATYSHKWHAKHDNKEKIEQIIKTKISHANNSQLDRYFDYVRDIPLEQLSVINIFKSLILKKPALFAKLSTKVFFDFLK
ncbi:MAG: NAD(P)/FAD-dependent oxidoreductase [Candidatus Cloacimonadales bacterium]